MLKDRILETLRFFDLQEHAPTLLELHSFLLPEKNELQKNLDANFEILESADDVNPNIKVSVDLILACIGNECQFQIENQYGYYFFPGRSILAENRWKNYFFALKREKLIRRFIFALQYIPFVRGVALGGSQAMGRQSEGSDIDLMIITDKNFMWLGRTLVTAYFQLLGIRRYGGKIANRFCLNHYLAGTKLINQIKNLYSAMEYARLRPVIYSSVIVDFQKTNRDWILFCFPNWQEARSVEEKQSKIQKILETLFLNNFGAWLEKKLKSSQEPRIKKEKFIVVENDELSFHPNSKQVQLLNSFFKSE